MTPSLKVNVRSDVTWTADGSLHLPGEETAPPHQGRAASPCTFPSQTGHFCLINLLVKLPCLLQCLQRQVMIDGLLACSCLILPLILPRLCRLVSAASSLPPRPCHPVPATPSLPPRSCHPRLHHILTHISTVRDTHFTISRLYQHAQCNNIFILFFTHFLSVK